LRIEKTVRAILRPPATGPGARGKESMDQASLRVLRWRVEGLVPRLGQAVLICILLWLQTRSWLAFAWLAGCMGASLVDAALSRRCLADLGNRRLAILNDLSRIISAVAFSSVCLLVLIDPSGFALAAAMLAACAINLNNAVMTSGSRRFVFSLMTPSSLVLLAIPMAAWATGHAITLTGAILLTIGAAAYTGFTARLAASLFREGEALRTALEAAQAASRAKSSFLAVTSHEIRTPLNGVLGMAQAMANDELSTAQRDRVGVIRQAGEALLDILNDILDLSKIEAGKLDLETAPFDLEAVARSAFGAFSATALGKGLDYRLDIAPAAHGVFEGDAARVRQVLCNLISNAVKFTGEGGVYVGLAPTALGVRLSVRDTGPGVPEGFAERLFEKFTQADSSTTRRFGGTGLGLAICRELCEAMGGCIAVENGPEGGAIFTVDLPLALSAQAAPSRPAEAAAPLAHIPAGERPLRVLAAEDNAVNQLVLQTLLEQIGVEATIVEDGAEAVAAWEQAAFDLILMDVQMPRMDGPEATRAIREREAATGRARTPIVALTANVMSHQVEAYSAAGMDAFVAKPIAIAELYAAIAQCVGADAPETETAPGSRVA
jgi:signal transduction histidine kinase/ActR/RegA family two-component response regulator